jgi:hypothetical protein
MYFFHEEDHLCAIIKVAPMQEFHPMQQITDPYKRPRFVSWRWKLMLPLFALVLIGAMVSAYLLADLPQVAETNAFAADARLQLVRLLSTATAAGVVIFVFVGINLFLGRVNRVTQVVEKLSYGNVKTSMLKRCKSSRIQCKPDYAASAAKPSILPR